jgi:hypothetical protein
MAMETILNERAVRLTIPEPTYKRAEREAARRHRKVEDHLKWLLERAIETEDEPRRLLEQVGRSYRAQRARAGKTQQSAEDRLEKMREIRERVAGELYP